MIKPLQIMLRRGSEPEVSTERMLHTLEDKYDLRPWIFTHDVVVDERAIPHSHPVLTLDTRHADDELMLLSELVHEQLHWFEEFRAVDRDRAIAATEYIYPNVPLARPEGAGSELSTRLHLLVCTLEHEALKQLVGIDEARRAVEALSRHHYCWVYRVVLGDTTPIRQILQTHTLWPAGLQALQRKGG